MSIPAFNPLAHHKRDAFTYTAAVVCGAWCLILLGVVGVLVYRSEVRG